jgi:hypothetical protein
MTYRPRPTCVPALAASLLALPHAASAATHVYTVGSYDRIRVEGPFEVSVVTGGTSGAQADGDLKAVEGLDIALQGNTLIVRMGHQGWGETPAGKAAAAPVVTLRTPALSALYVNGAAHVTVAGMRSQRTDLSVNGGGVIDVKELETDQLFATVIGSGSATLAGRALRERLVTSGAGNIDASAVVVNDLTVLQDGTGETHAAARYTAQVNTTGLGRVTVEGAAKCFVHNTNGGPVACGAGPAN